MSQTGRISYKFNEYYENNERCTWTIRANHRSKIKLTLTAGDLEKDFDKPFLLDYVSVTAINPQTASENGMNRIKWNSRRCGPQTRKSSDNLIFNTKYMLYIF